MFYSGRTWKEIKSNDCDGFQSEVRKGMKGRQLLRAKQEIRTNTGFWIDAFQMKRKKMGGMPKVHKIVVG